jgi:predicted transcriptional regulator
MKLEHYLSERAETQDSFAKRAKIPQSAVSRLCHGGDVRGRIWARISVATAGLVRPEDHFAGKAQAAAASSRPRSARAAAGAA